MIFFKFRNSLPHLILININERQDRTVNKNSTLEECLTPYFPVVPLIYSKKVSVKSNRSSFIQVLKQY